MGVCKVRYTTIVIVASLTVRLQQCTTISVFIGVRGVRRHAGCPKRGGVEASNK